MITSKHFNNHNQTISILYMPEIKHHKTLLPKLPHTTKTFNNAITSDSDRCVLSDLTNKTKINLQINGVNNETSYLQDEKSSAATNTDMQKNTFNAHWSFLHDSETSKINHHLSGMKHNDLKALYDTVNLNSPNEIDALLITILF